MSASRLEVRGLQAHFYQPGSGLVPALAGVDLAIRAGECLGVTGESGGGKSTLARALVGLVHGGPGVTGGTFLRDGQVVLRDFPHARYPVARHWRGFLFRHWQRTYRRRLQRLNGRLTFFIAQDPRSALNPYLTIGQQLGEALPERGAARRARIEDLLSQVLLPATLADRYPHTLSSGMCQRVVIAMALGLPAEVIVADEPVSKLDPRIRRRVIDLLGQIPASGRSLVLFTHQLDLIRHLAERVVVLFRGRVVEHGPAGQVVDGDGPRHPYTERLLAAYGGAAAEDAPGALARSNAVGCPYQPRCTLPLDSRCETALPPLAPLTDDDHRGRCWVRAAPEDTP